jgi:hypothetical protein
MGGAIISESGGRHHSVTRGGIIIQELGGGFLRNQHPKAHLAASGAMTAHSPIDLRRVRLPAFFGRAAESHAMLATKLLSLSSPIWSRAGCPTGCLRRSIE